MGSNCSKGKDCVRSTRINWGVIIRILYYVPNHLASHHYTWNSFDDGCLYIIRVNAKVPHPFERTLRNSDIPPRKSVGNSIPPTQMDPHTRNELHYQFN